MRFDRTNGNIIYQITKEQAEIIANHNGVDVNKLEDYQICVLLDKLIDETLE